MIDPTPISYWLAAQAAYMWHRRGMVDHDSTCQLIHIAAYAALPGLRAAARRPRDARKAIIAGRFASYGRTVRRDPTQLANINGWIARTNGFLERL